MVVFVEEIGEKGLVVDRELSLSYLREVLTADGNATGFSAVAPAMLHGKLEKVAGGGILLRGGGEVAVQGTCKRCLTDVKLTVPVEFTLNLVSKPKVAADDDEEEEPKKDLDGRSASFDLESVNQEVFSGREINLGDIFREQLLLALPMDVLCKDTCKGLCSVCGKDLNEGDCGHERKVADPRLAKLKDIKLN